jgi:hypothetical protein
VQKEDVAEVLRRLFFEPQSIANPEHFRQHAMAAVSNIAVFDEVVKRNHPSEEARFLASYPFHPDLTEVFYARWTQLEKFQRTRGILRTFALALRDAEAWSDPSPLVGPNVFLSAPGQSAIAEATRELTSIATRSNEERRQEWAPILEGELEKARAIQSELPALKFREVEQAVCAVFLSSQPLGHKAHTPDLFKLISDTRTDRIELEKALRRWTEISWFLDEAEFTPDTDDAGGGTKALPKAWRLGDRPNLKKMHHAACSNNVTPEMVEQKLLSSIQETKTLTQGAQGSGAVVHTLPQRPRDIEDDGRFHFAIMGPRAVSDSGKPRSEARRFIDETTAADRPRTKRNAVVLVAASRDGLEAARVKIREYLGWEEVRDQLKGQPLDPIREEMLARWTSEARKAIPDVVRQAWSIVIAVNEQNDIQAFKVTIVNEPLFLTIKTDKRARILDKEISAGAMLPGGPYDLWRADEASRRVKDIVGAFAEMPRLPRMLDKKDILSTINQGVTDGVFVASLVRPDKSVRTFWRAPIYEHSQKDPALELFLPEKATLSEVPPDVLQPGVLPELWKTDAVLVSDVIAYFAVGRTAMVKREGFEEPVAIPSCPRIAVETAVKEAVRLGKLWLVNGPASFQGEDVPVGALTPTAQVRAPHQTVTIEKLMPDQLADAWQNEQTTALSIAIALSNKEGLPVPWRVVVSAIDDAIKSRWLELDPNAGIWPSDFPGASAVLLKLPAVKAVGGGAGAVDENEATKTGVYMSASQIEPSALQDLNDALPGIQKAAASAGAPLRFRLEIRLGDGKPIEPTKLAEINKLLEPISPDLRLKQ